MKPPSISSTLPNRAFIVGCPRSGTTLLQSLLVGHPEILSFPESQFFLYLFSNDQAKYFTRSLLETNWTQPLFRQAARKLVFGTGLRNLRSRLAQFFSSVNCEHLMHTLPQSPVVWKQHYTQAFIQALDQMTLQRQQSTWIEKTPQHLHYVDYITQQVQNAKFIHVVRSGTDAIASLYDVRQRYPHHWDKAADIAHCTRQWLDSVKISSRYLQHPQHYFLRYEQLVAETEETLHSLCRFLGMTYHPMMLQRYQMTARSMNLDEEPWKRNASQRIRDRNSIKFHQVLTPQQRRYVLSQTMAINLEPLNSTQVPAPTSAATQMAS
jgi:hypothetical protein